MKKSILKEKKVCFNCKHMIWLVGLGLGVRCNYEKDTKKLPPIIPSLSHTCDKFEYSIDEKED